MAFLAYRLNETSTVVVYLTHSDSRCGWGPVLTHSSSSSQTGQSTQALHGAELVPLREVTSTNGPIDSDLLAGLFAL